MRKYIIYIAAAVLWMASACTDDKGGSGTVDPGDVPVGFSGISTRYDGSTSDLFVKAYLDNSTTLYFDDTRINFTGGLTGDPHPAVFPQATPYYPLGEAVIRFFAFSGRSDANDMMTVVAGPTATYDAVLSNYGKRQDDADVDPSYEGDGTPGNSTLPAELLQFRHVMTQLTVEIEVNEDELPGHVTKPPTNVAFTMEEIPEKGQYSIRSIAPDGINPPEVATGTSGHYSVVKGVNYLVPTGENLVGKKFRSLVIDDYTATSDDRLAFEIKKDDGSNDPMYLWPGYAYKLTITLERLQVTAVTLSPIPWVEEPVSNEDIDYNAYELNLNLGNYDNTGTKAVTKVVLDSSDGKTYVGDKAEDSDLIQFITLPPAGTVTTASLYTQYGLLITTGVTTEYTMTDLNLTNLSPGGMLPLNPGSPVTADNPLLVTTAVQFMNIDEDLSANAYYRQAANIDLSYLSLYSETRVFNGLGDFYGTYEGRIYWIGGLDINSAGLFASNHGTLRDVHLYVGQVDATGIPYAGSICGVNYGTIVAGFNDNTIFNSTATVGGICGLNESTGVILACLNTGDVRNGDTVGGICGENRNPSEGAIAANINTGSIYKQATYIGGIAGTSVVSGNNVIRSSYWLVGTAQPSDITEEVAVDTPGVFIYDSAALEPQQLRNTLLPGETQDKLILNRLNTEILLYSPWDTQYRFLLDRTLTGVTWPLAVRGQY